MIDKCKIHKKEKEKLLHLRRVVDLLTSAKTILLIKRTKENARLIRKQEGEKGLKYILTLSNSASVREYCVDIIVWIKLLTGTHPVEYPCYLLTLSFIEQVLIRVITVPLDFSTRPWIRGVCGLPLITRVPKFVASARYTPLNSDPLSLCRVSIIP